MTDVARARGDAGALPAASRTQKDSEARLRWLGKLLPRRWFGWGIVFATVGGALVAGTLYDVGLAILVLAGGALLAVIAVLWASLRVLAGDSPISVDEALALAAPPATEQQKRAILQAIKDLEYERSIGKVDDADYQQLLQRYRGEAKRLLRAMDEDLAPLRARAAAYVAKELGKPRAAGAAKGAKKEASESKPVPEARPCATCSACATDNDADAVFCKKCGGRLQATTATEKTDAGA